MGKHGLKKIVVTSSTIVGIVIGFGYSAQVASASSRMKILHNTVADSYITVMAQHGNIWANRHLKTKAHDASHYLTTKFKTHRFITVRKANGKKTYYSYIKNQSGKVHGWIWNGYLTQIVNKKKKNSTDTPTKKDNSNNKSNNDNSDDPKINYSEDDYRASFIKYINAERTKRGIKPLAEDAILDKMAHERAITLPDNYDHYKDGHNLPEELAKREDISNWNGECLGASGAYDYNYGYNKDGFTGDSAAHDDVTGMIYHDEHSNNGHTEILLDKENTKIGVSGLINPKEKWLSLSAIEVSK